MIGTLQQRGWVDEGGGPAPGGQRAVASMVRCSGAQVLDQLGYVRTNFKKRERQKIFLHGCCLPSFSVLVCF